MESLGEEQGSTFQLLGGSTTVMMALSLLARGQIPVSPADIIFKVTSGCPRLQYLPGPSTYGPRSQVHGKRTENDRLTIKTHSHNHDTLSQSGQTPKSNFACCKSTLCKGGLGERGEMAVLLPTFGGHHLGCGPHADRPLQLGHPCHQVSQWCQ